MALKTGFIMCITCLIITSIGLIDAQATVKQTCASGNERDMGCFNNYIVDRFERLARRNELIYLKTEINAAC